MVKADRNRATAPAAVAALEHMSGPARGETDWLTEPETRVCLGDDHRLVFCMPSEPEPADAPCIAVVVHRGGTFRLAPEPSQTLWVDGGEVPADGVTLADGDVVEFCDAGPISRLRLYRQGGRPRHTVAEIFGDAGAYLAASRRPAPIRLLRAGGGILRRLFGETSLLFRGSVVLAILALVFFAYRLERQSARLQEEIASGAARLDGFSAALARSRDEALTPGALAAVRQELAERLTSAADRLAALEERSQASAAVIERSISAVAFLQGAYGFREKASGRLLRHRVDAEGRKLLNPMGRPLLMVGGAGPVAERQYTGTGFALAEGAELVTNRHVALPWENDASAGAMAEQGLAPEMLRLVAYLSGAETPIEMTFVRASDDADLAILKPKSGTLPLAGAGLTLADEPPRQGAEVIVLGFPTGLRSLLAQTGTEFVEKLQADGATGFWQVAERLAGAGHVRPLASRGIVGQATAATIVYDAETTHGGSGGPVLDVEGHVVAVNTAILPEYGGSNLGVPVARLRVLLAAGDGG